MCVLTGEHFSHFPFLRSLTRLSNHDPPLSPVYDDEEEGTTGGTIFVREEARALGSGFADEVLDGGHGHTRGA